MAVAAIVAAIAAIVAVVAAAAVEEEVVPMVPLLLPSSMSTINLLSHRSHDQQGRSMRGRKNETTWHTLSIRQHVPIRHLSAYESATSLHRLLCVPCFLLCLLYLSTWLWYTDANVYEA